MCTSSSIVGKWKGGVSYILYTNILLILLRLLLAVCNCCHDSATTTDYLFVMEFHN